MGFFNNYDERIKDLTGVIGNLSSNLLSYEQLAKEEKQMRKNNERILQVLEKRILDLEISNDYLKQENKALFSFVNLLSTTGLTVKLAALEPVDNELNPDGEITDGNKKIWSDRTA